MKIDDALPANTIHDCSKCDWPVGGAHPAGEGMVREYANGWECDPFCPLFSVSMTSRGEHLHVICPRCGYRRVERCAS